MPENYHWSHWEKTVFFDHIDVAIIGGGIVGVNAAIHLKELKPNWRITIIERGVLPLGASTKNAGFACFGSVTELLDDLNRQSEDDVFALVEKRWRGLQRLRKRVGDQQMEYENLGAYELFRKSEETDFEECRNQLDRFNKILRSVIKEEKVFEIMDDKIESFGFKQVSHLINNRVEGQLNPGKMMKTLLDIARVRGVEIYSGVEVLSIENTGNGVTLNCNHQLKIKAAKILLATNGFAKRLLPELEVLPARNQVLITKPITNLPFKGCFHYDKGYYYFRNVGDRVLFGGGRNLAIDTETTDEFGNTNTIQDALISLLNTVILPDIPYEIDTWWSGILGVGNQKQPILKCIEKNIYTAVRLGGMGVAIGTLVGEEAATLIVDS
jgi:glycine/D-amino acid oxidase-like deaminating enzyme